MATPAGPNHWRVKAWITNAVCVAIVGGATFFASARMVRAAALWWTKTAVHTSAHSECISFAAQAMRILNFRNIRSSPDEVAGTSGGAYAAITCVNTSPQTAVVMVAGDNVSEIRSVDQTLSQKIAGIVKFA